MTNHLLTDGLTLHWHGMFLTGTPWMDGTAYITQCPILPRESFTYRFKASPVGTHWYHSQFSHQMMDGLFGMLIVHPALPTMPYFIATVMDWWNFEGNDIEIANPYGNMYKGTGEFQEYVTNRRYSHDNNELGTVSYFSVLVNGRGRQILHEKYPLERFKVTKDNQHRFRMAHNGAELSLVVTIDSHKLQVNYFIESLWKLSAIEYKETVNYAHLSFADCRH